MKINDAVDISRDAILFARMRPELNAYTVARSVVTLARLGLEARAWATRLCNCGEMTEGADERKRAKIFARAARALTAMGFTSVWTPTSNGNRTRDAEIEVAGDPRGSCLQITVRSRASIDPPRTFRF